MDSLPKMQPVTAENPCPVCEKPDWCLIAPDGSACLCQRVESGKRCGDAGWLHRLAEPVPPPAKAKPSKPKPRRDWPAQAERFAANLGEHSELRERLAEKLGLPPEALESFTLGMNGYSAGKAEFTIPERDGEGRIVGIATRIEAKGMKPEKKALTGSKRGLTLRQGWEANPGPVLIVEGFTDTAALTAAGLCAVGRASAMQGAELLAVLLADWPEERGIIVVGDNDEHGAGLDGAVRVARKLSGLLRRPVPFAMPPEGSKDVRQWLTDPARGETPWHERGAELLRHLEANAANPESPAEGEAAVRPHAGRKIVIGKDEYRVNDEACAALAQEADLYQRGGQLVAVVEQREEAPAEAAIRRPVGAPVVRPLTPAGMRERLTRCAYFVQLKETKEGFVERSEHPPYWCTSAVFDRGAWPVPRLEAVVTHPAFLANGSLLSHPGFDPSSGLYVFLEAGIEVAVPEHPTREDVARAVEALEDVIADFPFQTPAHKAAWFAGLLTVLAWFGFEGPAPLFLIDGNVRGVGKGLLADVVALIVFGRRFSTMAYTNDREELRKRITALALEGERAVLLDNLAGAVGNDVFDNALTSSYWKDRILSTNKNYESPLHLSWFGTGNNVQLGADTSRRVCHIRMESPEERPELKANFRHKELRSHVRRNRGKLLTAALTILRGWHVAGRPTHNLAPWGSFEGWSSVVREAVVFAGLPDPGLTREELQRHSDRDAAGMETVLEAIQRLDPNRHGLTTADLIQRCQKETTENAELCGAIEELCGKLDSRKLAGRFKHFQRRNFGGKMLDKAGEDRTKTNRWAVFAVGFAPNPSATAPASPASPAVHRPVAGDAGNAGAIPHEDAPAPAKPPRKRTFGNNPNRGEGGAP
jgi:hypothetical protein